jgi:superfamily I DNA/RNA helicase
MTLNEPQTQVVFSKENTLVTATAGAGKTRVLIAKVMQLLNEGVTLITLITFTRAAALEIQTRLLKILGVLPDGLVVGTFHSIISKHINEHSKVALMSSEEQTNLLHQHYNRHFGEHDGYSDFFVYFEKKTSGSLTQTNEEYELVIENYYSDMSEKTAGLIDLIPMGQSMIQDGEIPLLPTQWLLVDEYQDTDLEQVKFILCHGLSDVKLLMVGDPDQSIYGFRNALGVEAFNIIRENTEISDAFLRTNYRSRPEILLAAQKLISHNPGNKLITIEAFKERGGKVECIRVLNPYEEANLVASMIKKRDSKDVAIIARSNFRLLVIEDVLRNNGIKYTRKNTSSQSNVAELLFLSLISSLAKSNVANLTSFLEPILKNHDRAESVSKKVFNSNNEILSKKENNLYQPINSIYLDIRHHRYTESINKALAFAHKEFELLRFDSVYKIDSLGERLIKAKGTMKQRLFKLDMAFDKQVNQVQTMTGHSSKGLEFDTVYAIGFSEGIFPPKDMKSKKLDVEEERRIAFVVYTRAENNLTLLSPIQTEKGKSYGGVSRFVEEAEIPIKTILRSQDYYEYKKTSNYGE